MSKLIGADEKYAIPKGRYTVTVHFIAGVNGKTNFSINDVPDTDVEKLLATLRLIGVALSAELLIPSSNFAAIEIVEEKKVELSN